MEDQTATVPTETNEALEAANPGNPMTFEEAVEAGLKQITVYFTATGIRESQQRKGETYLHGCMPDDKGDFVKALNVWTISHKDQRLIYKECQNNALLVFELVGIPTIRQTITGNSIYSLKNAVIRSRFERDISAFPVVVTATVPTETHEALEAANPDNPMTFEEAAEAGLSQITVYFRATETRTSQRRGREGEHYLHGRIQDDKGDFMKALNVWTISRRDQRSIYRECQNNALLVFALVGNPIIWRRTPGNPIYSLENAVIRSRFEHDTSPSPVVVTTVPTETNEALEAANPGNPMTFEEAAEAGLKQITVYFTAAGIRESKQHEGETYLHGRIQDDKGGFMKELNVWTISRRDQRSIYTECQNNALLVFELVGTPIIRQTITRNPIYSLKNSVIRSRFERDLSAAPVVVAKSPLAGNRN